jgi:transposase
MKKVHLTCLVDILGNREITNNQTRGAQMEYIGLDVHKQYSVACVLDKDTAEVKFFRLYNSRKEFEKLFGKYDQQQVVLEASSHSYMVYDLIEDLVSEIQIANPSEVKAIANAAIKTDKIDAQTLAMLLSADIIPKTHIRNKDNRSIIQQLHQRMFLVRMRTRVKNRIHSLINNQSEEIRKDCPSKRDLFGKSGRYWLDNAPFPETDAKMLKSMLILLDALSELIKQSDGWVKELYNADPIAQRLATIPGIGKFLAVLIRNEIDDISRFNNVKKLHAYAGLVPSTHSSGGKTRHGKLVKNCNHILKWGLIEAVWPSIQADHWLNRIYRAKKKHKHTNIARTVVAKNILTIIYNVWNQNRNYFPVKPLSDNNRTRQP